MAEEFKVGFSTLIRGDLYPIKSIEKTQSTFHGRVVNGMKVVLLDDDLEICTYLPKKCVESINDAMFKSINDAGKTDQKFSVCYYGKIESETTSQFYGLVHGVGEGRNEKLFSNVSKMMDKYGLKRKAEDTFENSSPSKSVKQNNE